MASVRVEQLLKRFGKTVAVDRVDLHVAEGELVTLLGPSGCGKSTILRCIAGLADPDGGQIYFGDRLMNDVPTARRRIGLLFQRLALFPHMRVAENVAFGLRMQGRPRDEIARRVQEGLELVRLPGYGDRYPRELSGGQQQRVALARTLVTDPDILLFDEPLSSLDLKLRDELKMEIRRVHQQTGKTTVYVTHDQGEAFAIADKVYVMHEGRVVQAGTPQELYVHPTSPFVAAFIGANNFVPATAASPAPTQDRPGQALVEALGTRLWASGTADVRPGDRLLLLARPEDIEVLPGEAARGPNTVPGRVTASLFAGASTALEVAVGPERLKVAVHGADRFTYIQSVGREVRLHLSRCTLIRQPAAAPAFR
ncbi:MAG: ABC transporter ATP-binding protein [Candidatus Methylomirabilales bacterium]